MCVKLLTEHHLMLLSLKKAAQARLSLHLSKCNTVGNHMSRLIQYISFMIMASMSVKTNSILLDLQ